LEEGLFPHQNSLNEGRLEEERRLCYVGMTRARRQLYLSHSETRYRQGSRDFNRPSRFIHELPVELTEEIRLRSPKYSFSAQATPSASFRIGERVQHRAFGEGVVLQYEARVQVRFSKEGDKWFVAASAGLEKR
jgi:DNA helicase-2/ATP-dependent DNA helicase PcrA